MALAGSSNLNEQIAVLRPVLKLLSCYEVVIIGDREFRSVELANFLKKKKVCFALRLKQDAFVKKPGKTHQKLSEIGLAPGMKLFWSEINYTKETGFGKFSFVIEPKDDEKPSRGWARYTSPTLSLPQ